ncbi:MAG: hypothetical protein R3277_09090 [Brumimicrobium sp.]|nr:hypothetical protein [Brumimicrobium sp.]
MKFCASIFIILLSFGGYGQGNWEWTELASMPDSVSNNAVCEAFIENKKYVYSFGGISDSLTYADIHQRVFKYDVSLDSWSEKSPMPDTLGKIASAASFVKNKIYVIGGYHVDENGNEYTSNKVHVYNPFLDTFEIDGAPIPIPVDDHVQAVWRDSLIFVVTGWSNTSNVPDVQIYNPSFNSWTAASDLPNNNLFKCFGASGYILGDTIYYYGGVIQGLNFTAQGYLRRGIIDPQDPTNISWEYLNDIQGADNYRSACSGHKSTVFWIGGAEVAYNFDALAYDGTGIVNPSAKILEYNVNQNSQNILLNTPGTLMDHRGIAKLGGGNWIIAGGIDSLRQVSDRTYLVHNSALSEIDEALQPPFFEVNENPDHFIVVTENVGEVKVYDILGRLLFEEKKSLADLYIPKADLEMSLLLFVYDDGSNLPVTRKKVKP